MNETDRIYIAHQLITWAAIDHIVAKKLLLIFM